MSWYEDGKQAAIPVVECPETYGGDGVPGSDPSLFGTKRIVIMNDPDNEQGLSALFSLDIEGPNDIELLKAIDNCKNLDLDPVEKTNRVYQETAELKRQKKAIAKAQVAKPVIPILATEPEKETKPMQAEKTPPVLVEFLLGDNGEIAAYYENIVINGDTLVLISAQAAPGAWSYIPPKSTENELKPITMRIAAETPIVVTAFRIQDTYCVSNKVHVVLRLDR